jgi:hypothetical protein
MERTTVKDYIRQAICKALVHFSYIHDNTILCNSCNEMTNCSIFAEETPWPESASELHRPSDRRLSAKLVPTFADRGCHVVSVTDPYSRILNLLDRIFVKTITNCYNFQIYILIVLQMFGGPQKSHVFSLRRAVFVIIFSCLSFVRKPKAKLI